MNDDLGFADWELRCHWSRWLIELREGMRRSGGDDLCESLDALLFTIVQVNDCAFDRAIWLTLDLGYWMSELDAEVVRD